MKALSKNEVLNTYNWIRVKRFEDDDKLPVADRLERLRLHHEAETTFLINLIRDIVDGKVVVNE